MRRSPPLARAFGGSRAAGSAPPGTRVAAHARRTPPSSPTRARSTPSSWRALAGVAKIGAEGVIAIGCEVLLQQRRGPVCSVSSRDSALNHCLILLRARVVLTTASQSRDGPRSRLDVSTSTMSPELSE